jgi:signaling intermediate in Toll pathway protein
MDSAKTKSQLSNREQFNLVLNEFLSREKYRRGHVTFINMALERMEEFELQKDLVSYNRLLDVFPKGRYRPKRLLDAIWPRHLPQTELALELLTVMEDNYVWPDATTRSILEEVFGKRSLPVEKCERMVYWYERYKDADPYWISGEVPEDGAELSRIALQRIVNEGGNIIEHEVYK